MQKIIIKNFGPITEADIEIKKILVLIGEQASGKSTVAKLIYFFKRLKNDLLNQMYSGFGKENIDITNDLIEPIKEKFYGFFGSTFHLPNFNITYYYDFETNKYLELSLDKHKKLIVKFSDKMLYKEINNEINDRKKAITTELNNEKFSEKARGFAKVFMRVQATGTLVELLDGFFNNHQTDSLYVIAGRNATVSYSDLFGKYLFASLQNSIETNKKQSFKHKQNTIDESLMLEFIEKTEHIKAIFLKYGGFDGLIDLYATDTEKKQKMEEVKKQIDTILKGKYTIDNSGEKLVFDGTNTHIKLSNASSGQQESIRILQDIFLTILDYEKVFRIIEEPEAHLFPVAQKQLIELLCLMVNGNADNQFVITTHSPYVLSIFNNLLFAARVAHKNPELEGKAAAIIPQKYWINMDDFSAYSLGNSGEGIYCKPIANNSVHLIDRNYLDEVSEMFGGDFNALYALHASTFARR